MTIRRLCAVTTHRSRAETGLRGSRLTPATLAVLVALTLAGCGGEDSDEHYTADATAACLEQAGVSVDDDRGNVDIIAADASEGALRAEANGAEVIISFAAGTSEADNLAQSYQGAYSAMGDESGEVQRHGNAVVAWSGGPGDAGDTVEDCLTE
jgi:hypothetical protein